MKQRRKRVPKKPEPIARPKPITNALNEVLDAFKLKGSLARGVAEIASEHGIRRTTLLHTDGSSVFAFGDVEIVKRVYASNGFHFLVLRGSPGDMQGPIVKILSDLSNYYAGNPRAFRLIFPLKNKSLPEFSAEACNRFKAYYDAHVTAGIGQAANVKMSANYLEQKYLTKPLKTIEEKVPEPITAKRKRFIR